MADSSSSGDTAVLTYWDGRGNAELIRLMMTAAGQHWVDRVYQSEEAFLTSQDQAKAMIDAGVLAFDQVPLLQVDGLNIVQKMAALRHLARKHNMYGSTPAEATKCDIIAECIQDFIGTLKRSDMAGSLTASLTKSGPKFERMLTSNDTGSGYLVGSRMTFVDILFFDVLVTGVEIGVSLDAWPVLKDFCHRVTASPHMAAYLSSNKRFPMPGLPGYMDRVKNTMPWLFGEGSAPAMTSSVWNFENK